MDYKKIFKKDILMLLSDDKEHSGIEITEYVAKNFLHHPLNKKNHHSSEKVKLNIEWMITNLFNYQYIKKSKSNVDNWLITEKGKNFIKNNETSTNEYQNFDSNDNPELMEVPSLKKDINIIIEELNQKIESNNYEIYEMINVIVEDLNKTNEKNSNRITALENVINYKIDEIEVLNQDNFKDKDNIFELLKYLEVTYYNKYLTIQDLNTILNNLKPCNNKYSKNNLIKLMIKFYQKNNLNPDEYIIEGRNTTYFMGVSIFDSSIINKISMEIIRNWINNNIIFTDNRKDKLLFDDLTYELVKSFKLNNVNKIYYENIDSGLKSVLRSFYNNTKINTSMIKNNDLIICFGLKYKTELNTKKIVTKTQTEDSIKSLIYTWLTKNLIRTSSNYRLALNEIYDNIYPYLNKQNISFKKTNVTREIGRSINNIYKGKDLIKREVINNQTIYLGLKLKNSINNDNSTNKDNNYQLSTKTKGELVEEWLNNRIIINQSSEKKLYLDEITSAFINDLNQKNIEIKDSSGLRSTISRVLRKFYKQKTNKQIDTAQDEQLKRYYKNIQIKNS